MKYFLIAALLLPGLYSASQNTGITGYWAGELPSQKKYTVAVHIAEGKVLMDSPGEGLLQIPAVLTEQNDSLFITIKGLRAVFEGQLKKNGQQISGRWKQGSVIAPLTLNKTGFPVVYSKVKSQTPGPADRERYRSFEVAYANADSSVLYGATITMPARKLPFEEPENGYPAVILVSGSGQQNRDGEILGHKPLWVIADHLMRQGFLVLRADDRGTGKTRGDLKKATSADFAGDVEAALDFLLQYGGINKKQIGIIGHSEGGMIAPMVAVKRKEIAFLVLLAAPGYANIDLMADQNEAIFKQSGYSNETAARYRQFYRELVPAILNAPADSIAIQNGAALFRKWQQTENATIVNSITGVPQNTTPEKFVKTFVAQLNNPWMRFFMGYDPQPNLRKLTIPVLALNGSNDIQVLPRSLKAIEEALKEAGNTRFVTAEMPGLNHLFQQCYYCTTAEYAQLQESFSPKALEKIINWIWKVMNL